VRETPVLNDYGFGGYLIWNGGRPLIDSRADLYGDIFLQNYAAITAPDQDALAATLTYYHVRWTIFSAQAPVVKLLDSAPGWHRFMPASLRRCTSTISVERPRGPWRQRMDGRP
jgi:hypothetical protein